MRRFVRSATCATVIGAMACTAPEPKPPPPRPDVTGQLLALSNVSSAPLVRFDVPTLEVSPSDGIPADPAVAAAAADAAGVVVAASISRDDDLRVFRVDAAGTVERVGPALQVAPEARRPSLSVAAGRVAVADCSSVSALSLDDPSSWMRIGTGCSVGLSSDGREIAFDVGQGAAILTCILPCDRPSELVDVASLPTSTPDAPPWHAFGALAWGPNGLAFAAKSGDEAGFFVADAAGSVRTIARTPLENTNSVPSLAWDPGGRILAIADDLGVGGVIRLFDTSTDTQRVIALDALGFDGLVWSPDGTAVATITSADALLVVGTDERWRLRVDTTWSDLLAWTG